MTEHPVTPPPPISIPNSASPEHPSHITIDLEEPTKQETVTRSRKIVDVVRFFLFGFILAFWMGILALALPFFYRRLHVTNRRRKISFGIGNVLGAIGGLVWQGWILFLLVVVLPSS